LETRNSNGLEQFWNSIQDQSGLSILDFAGASQSTITFVTNRGHRLYSDDILLGLDEVFGSSSILEAHGNPRLIEQFLAQSLNFPEATFDGALLWDSLQFLAPPLLQITVDRLHKILKPDAYLLAFFHADERVQQIPVYQYRIEGIKQIQLVARGHRKPAQTFNNRSLEKLFQDFQSVKFFLTRDHLREVIVRR
jgi:hypothetical protein